MTRILRLAPLGVEVDLELDDTITPEFEAELRESWADVLGGDGEADEEHAVTLDLGRASEEDVISAETEARVASQISTQVTLDAIEHHGGRLVMIHAAGLALEDGRVIAFVGPSGRGKTTLAKTLGQHYGYVTDETLAVAFDGSVRPYRKPLSVIVDPMAPKQQLSPLSLGLKPLPQVPLKLAAIVMLHRVEEHELGDEPAISPVATGSAIATMVPELSYLPALPDPLVQLAELIDATGGVRRVTYSEATQIVDLVPSILDACGDVQPWVAGHVEEKPADVGLASEEPVFRRKAGVRWLLFANEAVTLEQHMVRQLAGIAPGLWELLDDWVSLTQLTEELVAQYGEVPDARNLVEVAIDGLVDAGLAERAGGPAVGGEPRAAVSG